MSCTDHSNSDLHRIVPAGKYQRSQLRRFCIATSKDPLIICPRGKGLVAIPLASKIILVNGRRFQTLSLGPPSLAPPLFYSLFYHALSRLLRETRS